MLSVWQPQFWNFRISTTKRFLSSYQPFLFRYKLVAEKRRWKMVLLWPSEHRGNHTKDFVIPFLDSSTLSSTCISESLTLGRDKPSVSASLRPEKRSPCRYNSHSSRSLPKRDRLGMPSPSSNHRDQLQVFSTKQTRHNFTKAFPLVSLPSPEQ
jgi:hypothetical protein